MAMNFVSFLWRMIAFTFARCLCFVLSNVGVRCSIFGFRSWNCGGRVRHD